MSKTRNLSDLLDANGDVKSTALDNVPASNDASALTTGTLPDARLSSNVTQNGSTQTLTNKTINASNNTLSNIPNSALSNSAITINGSATSLGGSATINTELVNDSSPELGANLSSNGNDINFGDNDKAQFGASNDLQIYHDGSNSFIQDAGTGSLVLQGTNLLIRTNNGDNVITATENAEVTLAYDNATKLQTTSTGIAITGDVDLGDNEKVTFGNGEDLIIFHDGSNSIIKEQGGGDLMIRGQNDIFFQTEDGSETYARYKQNDAVELYHDNSKKFETTSTGVTVTGTVSATNSIGMWVDFNAGNDSISDDYNVSSITNRTTGRNTVNYTSNLTNNNYAIAGMARVTSNDGGGCTVSLTSGMHITYVKVNSQCTVDTITTDNSLNDAVNVCVMAVRA